MEIQGGEIMLFLWCFQRVIKQKKDKFDTKSTLCELKYILNSSPSSIKSRFMTFLPFSNDGIIIIFEYAL